MYIQGVSTRKVTHISEELSGEELSPSTVSRLSKNLDDNLWEFAKRKLSEEYPYLILDARYEKVRDHGVIRSQAVLVAIGVSWDGKREVLGIELAPRESKNTWRELLLSLKERGLEGVQMVMSDAHEGLVFFENLRAGPEVFVVLVVTTKLTNKFTIRFLFPIKLINPIRLVRNKKFTGRVFLALR